ncbi:phosphate uptake regulator PhoU [Candidatus Woesearchaeota archaeon]|nr:phosphate uptake regulator PhoU [Candidatus Woesearchaeota archaeon]
MKRKIIKQGHSTLTITLPSKWAQDSGLKAGDEIDLLETENGLLINTQCQQEFSSVVLNIDNDFSTPILWKYFCAVYRAGYDEITVKFQSNKKYEDAFGFITPYARDPYLPKEKYEKTILAVVQDITNRFIGMEIIEHSLDHCVIKEMEEPSAKEFENAMRRVFFIIQQMFNDVIGIIETRNFDRFADVHILDMNIDRFHDFCCRILNKMRAKSQSKAEIIYTTLFILELLADEFKHISNYYYNARKHSINDAELKRMKQFMMSISEQFNMYHDLYYNFDHEKVKKIYGKCADLFAEPLIKNKNNDEGLLHHLRKISEFTYSLTELRIEMEYSIK